MLHRLFASIRLAAAVWLLLPALVTAQDVYIESKVHTDAIQMMGQSVPAQDGVSRTWIGEGRIAVQDDTNGSWVIFRGDQNKMYIVYPKDKTYYESTLPFQFPPEMQKMIALMKPAVTVTPTTQTKVVNGFNTKLSKVTIKMMGQEIIMDYWTSTEVPLAPERIREFTQVMLSSTPMLGEVAQKMSAIEGYPVRIDSRVTAMGNTFGSWQEVTKVEKKAAPAGTFDVPRGFTKSSTIKMGRG